jgi:hypothetical protein
MDATSAAKVGDQVVCVDDIWDWSFSYGQFSIPVRVPMLNEVLTISGIVTSSMIIGHVALTFVEIDEHQCDGPLSGNVLWCAECFRPLESRPTNISVFTALLNKAPAPALEDA